MHPAVHQHIHASANDASSPKAQCITMRDSGAWSDLARNQSYDEILSAFCILHADFMQCISESDLRSVFVRHHCILNIARLSFGFYVSFWLRFFTALMKLVTLEMYKSSLIFWMSGLRCILGSPDPLQDSTHLGALCLEQRRSKRENVIGHFVCAKCALHFQSLRAELCNLINISSV